jgi:hypothetical protein
LLARWNFSIATAMSFCLTMEYLSNTERVFEPLICMMMFSETPTRSMFRAVARRKSWNSSPGHPAEMQAFFQSPRKLITADPSA